MNILTVKQVKQIHEVIEKHWHDLSADYDMPEATALPEYSYDWQAIADELNVTLGRDDDYEAKMDALLCRLTNGKWSKSRAYDLDFMVSCVDEEYEKAYAGKSDREAELESLAKDLYENAVDFNFKGWMPYYRDRFAALGIEVDA